MKTLKLDHELAELVRQGLKTATWRMFDDKNINVGEKIDLIDKVNPNDADTWLSVGTAVVTDVIEKELGDITEFDFVGHETFKSPEEMLSVYKRYYGAQVSFSTLVKIIHFKLDN